VSRTEITNVTKEKRDNPWDMLAKAVEEPPVNQWADSGWINHDSNDDDNSGWFDHSSSNNNRWRNKCTTGGTDGQWVTNNGKRNWNDLTEENDMEDAPVADLPWMKQEEEIVEPDPATLCPPENAPDDGQMLEEYTNWSNEWDTAQQQRQQQQTHEDADSIDDDDAPLADGFHRAPPMPAVNDDQARHNRYDDDQTQRTDTQHFSLTQADDNLRAIFENVDTSTKFLERKQAEQEQVNARLASNMEKAGSAISKLNGTLLGLQQAQESMGSTLTALSTQLNQLTTQLQQVLSQKADIPTKTDKSAEEPEPKKSKPKGSQDDAQLQQS
jgi:vacuolar-type H+-ATPase subunit I/STV1